MIISASKPQIWPCFAVGSGIDGDVTALPWLRSLSVVKLAGRVRYIEWKTFESHHRRSETETTVTLVGNGSGVVAVLLLLVYLVAK